MLTRTVVFTGLSKQQLATVIENEFKVLATKFDTPLQQQIATMILKYLNERFTKFTFIKTNPSRIETCENIYHALTTRPCNKHVILAELNLILEAKSILRLQLVPLVTQLPNIPTTKIQNNNIESLNQDITPNQLQISPTNYINIEPSTVSYKQALSQTATKMISGMNNQLSKLNKLSIFNKTDLQLSKIELDILIKQFRADTTRLKINYGICRLVEVITLYVLFSSAVDNFRKSGSISIDKMTSLLVILGLLLAYDATIILNNDITQTNKLNELYKRYKAIVNCDPSNTYKTKAMQILQVIAPHLPMHECFPWIRNKVNLQNALYLNKVMSQTSPEFRSIMKESPHNIVYHDEALTVNNVMHGIGTAWNLSESYDLPSSIVGGVVAVERDRANKTQEALTEKKESLMRSRSIFTPVIDRINLELCGKTAERQSKYYRM